MILETGKCTRVVFWQTPKSQDCLVGEPAVVLQKYSDVLSLRQEDNVINITVECVPEFLHAVKLAMKEVR